MKNLPLFTQSEVCGAASIDPNTIRLRRSRGQFDLGSGTGHKRYSFVEAYQVALMVELERVGFSIEEAYDWVAREDVASLLSKLHDAIMNGGEIDTKNYFSVLCYFDDTMPGGVDFMVQHFTSADADSLGDLFRPVETGFSPNPANVASIRIIEIESVVATMFSRLSERRAR